MAQSMAATAVIEPEPEPQRLDLGLGLNPKAPEFQMPSGFNPDAPEFKPVEWMLRPEAAEFIPMAGGWATLQAAAEAYQNKQKRQMPFATDEEWEQRIQKREKEVETIKSLQSYRLYIEVFPHDQRGEDDPKTPDPRDRTVSKRMWKWNVEKWRLQLKSRCVYSRSVLLQCREALALLGNGAAESDPAPVSSEAPATGAAADSSSAAVAEEARAAGSGEEAKMANLRAEPNERPLKTMSLPEQPSTIPSGPRRPGGGRGEAGYKANAPQNGAGTFQ